ncbi:MAG TPA: HflX family GTPase [Firmicutes bacterium]|nr:HflX family GTPase [Bacillota bacterium]
MTRVIETPSHQRILLTDTVGFIRKLPPHLIASFHSTLEEAVESDALLHVADASHPCLEEQIATVENILHQLRIAEKPTILVLNKSDMVTELKLLSRIQQRYQRGILTSALSGQGIDNLKMAIAELLRQHWVEVQLRIPLRERQLVSWIHRVGDILSEAYQNNEVLIQAHLDRRDANRLTKAAMV